MTKLLTIKQVSEIMQVHVQTVYRWTEQGKIQFTKLPGGNLRFDQAKLESWIQRRTARISN